MDFRGQRASYFIVNETHDILEVPENLSTGGSAIATYGQRPQDFLGHMSWKKKTRDNLVSLVKIIVK